MGVRAGVVRPKDPPPPPPRPQFQRTQWKSKSMPPVKIKEKTNRVEASKSGDSIRIKIKEVEETSVDSSQIEESSSGPSGGGMETLEVEEEKYHAGQKSVCSNILNYVLERQEYLFPEAHGWRIKFRRIFLHLGVIGFSFTTFETLFSTESYSSKAEIQKILDFVGTNLTWPDEGSALDDVFALYNQTQQRKSYVMIAASILFWSSIAFDTVSYWTTRKRLKDLCVVSSRVVNFIGSLLVFASVILVGLPDYLEASHLDEICPYCGRTSTGPSSMWPNSPSGCSLRACSRFSCYRC